jgi:hypothetical protein
MAGAWIQLGYRFALASHQRAPIKDVGESV